jgi:hypothetical protein
LTVSPRTTSSRQAEHLRAAAVVAPDPLDQFDGSELLARVIRAQLAALDRLEQLAANPDNTAAGVGACRAVSSTSANLIDSLIAAGRLPDRRESWELGLRTEAARVLGAIRAVATELGIPEDRSAATDNEQKALARHVYVGVR